MASLIMENVSASYAITERSAIGMRFYRKRKKVISALKDVSIDLQAGDRVGLIGSNGSGKSTLLKVMGGILPIRSGRIYVDGARLVLLNKRSGMIGGASLYENALVKAAGFGFKGRALRTFARDVLESSNLSNRANDPLSSLSAGMSAQFAIAVNSKVAKPIMLLDEWIGTTNVDQESSGSLLEKINEDTDIVVLASHNKRLIRKLCNKVICLQDGQVAYFGKNFKTAYACVDRS